MKVLILTTVFLYSAHTLAIFKNSLSCHSCLPITLKNNKNKRKNVGKKFTAMTEQEASVILVGGKNNKLKVYPWMGIEIIPKNKTVVVSKRIVSDSSVTVFFKSSKKSKVKHFLKCEKS
ncbi:MAG: hypothetical protein HRT44_08735 [Bdellovibrionales bacterium]|nr:hypothetical protein [Bdellovibrionales bacterium]